MKSFILKYQYVIFASLGTMVVLWQLLLPGYVILLDWPVGPLVNFRFDDVTTFMNAPLNLLLKGLNLFLPGWIIQKFLMLGMFFGLFYLPLKFYPVMSCPTVRGLRIIKKSGGFGKYVTAMFFAINPFVYERFLAGQWRVIVGYLLLFPLVSFLIKFQRVSNWKNTRGIFISLFVISLFSIHFLAIGGVIIFIFIIFELLVSIFRWIGAGMIIPSGQEVKKENTFGWLWKVAVGGIAFLIFSTYWLIPYQLQEKTVLDNFDGSHQRAFATARDDEWGVLKNVTFLHGFWGEDHKWVDQFILPKETPFFRGIFFLLGIFSLVGLFFMLRSEKCKKSGWLLFGLFLFSLVASAGVRDNIFQEFNRWLFDNISFWKGFRDTQKWTGVTALVYSLLAGHGGQKIIQQSKRLKIKNGHKVVSLTGGVLILNLFIVLIPNMFWGFNGQVKTVWYPQEWQKVNEILKIENTKPPISDNGCRALTLPWHQYYSVAFNENKLSYNLSHNYFNCDIIAGHNTELWGIKSIAGTINNYQEIEKFVTSNNPNSQKIEEGLEMLKSNGIQYIILIKNAAGSDLYKYPFLKSLKMEKVNTSGAIVLYKIK